MDVTIELFAQVHDADHERLSIILSGDQIVLQPEGQPRFQLCRGSLRQINDLVRRHDAAVMAANPTVNAGPEQAC